MAYKESTEAEKEAYMEFWSERKPESFALDVWVDKMETTIRIFCANPLKEKIHISKYSDASGRIMEIMEMGKPSAPIYGIHKDMSIIQSHMQLIHKHEKRGTSLMAVSAIEDRLNEVRKLFEAGARENNWVPIIEGEKLLQAPLKAESFAPYNEYSWLSECHTAQDVAATLWVNLFNQLLVEARQKEPPYMFLFNLGLMSPFGTTPRFSGNKQLGAVQALSNLSFRDIVAEATACIPGARELLPKNPWPREEANEIKNKFVEKARAFIDNVAPKLHSEPGLY